MEQQVKKSLVYDKDQAIITYTPYRGESEPIIDVEIAQIQLFPNLLEVKLKYTYQHEDIDKYGMKVTKTDIVDFKAPLPKDGVVFGTTIIARSIEGEETEVMSVFELKCGNWDAWLHMRPEDHNAMYDIIRAWQFYEG